MSEFIVRYAVKSDIGVEVKEYISGGISTELPVFGIGSRLAKVF